VVIWGHTHTELDMRKLEKLYLLILERQMVGFSDMVRLLRYLIRKSENLSLDICLTESNGMDVPQRVVSLILFYNLVLDLSKQHYLRFLVGNSYIMQQLLSIEIEF